MALHVLHLIVVHRPSLLDELVNLLTSLLG